MSLQIAGGHLGRVVRPEHLDVAARAMAKVAARWDARLKGDQEHRRAACSRSWGEQKPSNWTTLSPHLANWARRLQIRVKVRLSNRHRAEVKDPARRQHQASNSDANR